MKLRMSITSSHDLARHLTEAIASGQQEVGSLLPTEFELCARHGLSRYAVRKALDELQEQGLVSRRKNVGTRVEARAPRQGFTQSIVTAEELAQFGSRHVRQVREVVPVVADLALAGELGVPGGTRLLRLSSLRMEAGGQGRPMGWTDVYVDERFAGIEALARQSPDRLVSALIEERYGTAIVRIRQEIGAITLSPALAAELQAEPGAAALKITRSYLDAEGEAIEISVSIHPADRFTLTMEMNRSRERGA
jgi:DNA-binding GntR family transcriptional regulator